MIDYIEDGYANVSLDTGGYLCVYPDTGAVLINGELELSDEDMKDVIFYIGGGYYTAQQVLQLVVADWDAVLKEQEQAAEDERRMAEELSSPEKTGRV